MPKFTVVCGLLSAAIGQLPTDPNSHPLVIVLSLLAAAFWVWTAWLFYKNGVEQ